MGVGRSYLDIFTVEEVVLIQQLQSMGRSPSTTLPSTIGGVNLQRFSQCFSDAHSGGINTLAMGPGSSVHSQPLCLLHFPLDSI